MKGLTLTQPYASLIAGGWKKVETRSWRTDYVGPVAIHAAKGQNPEAKAFTYVMAERGWLPAYLPLGAIVAVANLDSCGKTEVAVRSTTLSDKELMLGDYGLNRWAWYLRDVRALPEPVFCKGALGLWTVPDEIAARLT